MPAKRKIQKEDILKASISIISHEGLNALNARKLAKKLGCSTQPLFYIYENMDDLKKDVIDEIVKIFDREVSEKLAAFYPIQENESIADYLYCRSVTCPSCGERAPLLNAFALQKKSQNYLSLCLIMI